MVRIRRFGVVKTATVVAVMYLLVTVAILIPIAILVALFGRGTEGSAGFSFLILAVFLGLFYAVIGWIFTALACAIYNIAAGWVGGVEVQLETVEGPTAPPAWSPPTTSPLPPPGTMSPPYGS